MKRVLVLACCIAATPAAANWQYTQWGMTAPQIAAASKGAAHASGEGPNTKCAFTGKRPIAAGRYRDFDAVFCSRDGRTLESVALRKTTDNPDAIRRELLSVYGHPVSANRIVTVWNDPKHRNIVTFVDIAGVGAVIEYKPAGGASGL